MAITHSLELSVGVNFAGEGTGPQVAGSVTTVTGEIWLVVVHANMWNDTTGVPTGITGPGLTFTNRVQTGAIDSYSKISIWTGKVTSGGTGDITVTVPSPSGWDGYVVDVLKLTGVKSSGTNGADCIVSGQTATATGSEPLTATLPGAMTTGNRALACGGTFTNSLTPQTCTADFSTEVSDHGTSLPDTGSYSMYTAVYLSADHTDNAATLDWSGTAAGGYGAAIVELDAEPGGTTLSGSGASIATASGSLSAAAESGLVGGARSVAVSSGSLGNLSGLSGQALSILVSHGLLTAQAGNALTGRNAASVVAQGSPVPDVAGLTVSGRTAAIGAAHGAFPASSSLIGQGASIAVSAGFLGPSDAYALTGGGANVAVSHGSVGTGGQLSSASASVSVQHGQLGQLDAYQLTGLGSNIALSHGSFGAGGTNLSGLTLSISTTTGLIGLSSTEHLPGSNRNVSVSHGSLGNVPSQQITGQSRAVATSHGLFIDLSSEEQLLGREVSIHGSMGSLGSPGGSVLSGRSAAVLVVSGLLGQSDNYDLAGQGVSLSVSHGQFIPSADRALSPMSRSISVASGNIGASGDGQTGVIGLALGIQVNAGQLGGGPVYPLVGQGVSVSVQHGSILSVSPLLGRFVGIAVSSGLLGEQGTSNSALGSSNVNLQTAAGTVSPIAQENMPSLGSRIGANQLPANPADRNGKGVYTVTDVSLAVLLEFLKTSIRAECGAMYESVMGTNDCVKLAIPFDTLEWDNLSDFEYPLISVHPEGHGESFAVEIGLEVKPQNYVFRYILPVMTARKFYVMNGFLSAVDNAVRAAISNGFHPDFENGAQVLVGDDSLAQMKTIKIKSSRRGRIHLATEIHHNMIETKIYVEEVIQDNPNILQTLTPLRGIDGVTSVEDLPISEWSVSYS